VAVAVVDIVAGLRASREDASVGVGVGLAFASLGGGEAAACGVVVVVVVGHECSSAAADDLPSDAVAAVVQAANRAGCCDVEYSGCGVEEGVAEEGVAAAGAVGRWGARVVATPAGAEGGDVDDGVWSSSGWGGVACLVVSVAMGCFQVQGSSFCWRRAKDGESQGEATQKAMMASTRRSCARL
jgi:hypothetical protein